MRLFRSFQNRTAGVRIDSDSGSSFGSGRADSQDSGESDYSDESFGRDAPSRTSWAAASAPSARLPPSRTANSRNPPSARSQGSNHGGGGGSSGRRTPTSMASPSGFVQGGHLRSLSNTGTSFPVAASGGALIPLRRGPRSEGSGNDAPPRAPLLLTSSPPPPPQMLGGSLRSMNASMAFSNYMANAMLEKKPTMNILVIGAPQVGKSMFINAYRAAVTNTLKWPTAPVGICGFYGTTSAEPFPNHPTEPSWMCIDTPGRFYNGDNDVVLEKLVEGIPWKSKLAGAKSLSLAQLKDLTPIAANAAHQCVVVVPATDLVEDQGWGQVLRFRSRYLAAADAGEVVLYLKGLVSLLRALLNDTAPFLVISKMDKVGGCQCHAAKEAILSLVSQCVPVNRVFFASFPENSSALSFKQNLTLDSSTRENLIQLHEEICFAVQWKRRVKDL